MSLGVAVEETTDIFGVTHTAAPSVYFHLPVFTGKRQRCQQFSVEQLQSHHNYCQGEGWGRRARSWGAGGESGPNTKRWGPNQLLPLKFFSCVPEAVRLAWIEQFGRIEWVLPTQLGVTGWGGNEGTWTRVPGPLGKQCPEGGIWKGRGKGGWLEPKGSPVRYKGQGERWLPW